MYFVVLLKEKFEYILNVTEYVNENYLRVKEKFLRAIDYVENINVDKPTTNDPHPDTKEIVRVLLIPE